METRQARRNRHIVQAQTLNVEPVTDNGNDNLREAQLLLHSLLSQKEIAELNRQMVEAGSIKRQKEVLAAWYDEVERRESEPTNIYEMVKAAINGSDGHWPKTVYVNGRVKMWVSAYNQELFLNARVDGDVTKHARVKCGQLHYIDGWMFTLKQAQYKNWVGKVKGLLK